MKRALVLFLCALLTGCAGGAAGPLATSGTDVAEHWMSTYDPRTQGSTPADVERNFNLFRGQWWNLYARGRWFLELGHPERAAADFRAALAMRADDEREARSYGMHFWEYFPHRELGVALFTLESFSEAARELERSLATEDSGRAKFYLNRARAAILRSAGSDTAPPAIAVDQVGNRGLVNTPTFTLRGTATDDTYVAGVRIAGSAQFVELAEPRIEFAQPLTLRPGENTVRVEAEDLVGRSLGIEVRIVLDSSPPVLSLDAPREGAQIGCFAADDRGLAHIALGGKTVPCGGARTCAAWFDAAETGAPIPVEVHDLAGNVTRAAVDLAGMTAAPRGKGALLPNAGSRGRQFALLAGGRTGTVSDVSPALVSWRNRPGGLLIAAAEPGREDRVAPRIELNLPVRDARLTTMEETLYLDGTIYDPGGVAALEVNGEPIPVPPQGGLIVFSHVVSLSEGDNVVEVRAADRAGNAGSRRVEIRRVPAEALGEAARYSVGFLPPDRKPAQAESGDFACDALLDALLREPVRFRLVERSRGALEQILVEHRLSDLAARGTAIRIGKLISAEGVLFGRVQEDRAGITLELRLVDTETTEILLGADVYGEQKDLRSLRWLANGLVSKLKVGFPLIQGEVVGIDGRLVRLSIGREQGLRKGMRLLFYRQEKQGALTMQELLRQGNVAVQAKVSELVPGGAVAEISSAKAGSVLRARDWAVTK